MAVILACAGFCWRHCSALVSVILGAGIISASAVAFARLRPDATFSERAQILEITLLAFGLLSILLLIAQLRQTRAWNRVLSYHEYFGELPGSDRTDQLYLCLHRLGLHEPTSSKPLSTDDAKALWDDEGIAGRDGICRHVGRRVIREYLNDFEEFCGAVRAGVLNENYVRELEGDRTINAYYGFEEVIKLTREEAADSGRREQSPDTRSTMAQKLREYRRKPYQELRMVAETWRARRAKEYEKLAKKRRSLEESIADHERWGGVGPST